MNFFTNLFKKKKPAEKLDLRFLNSNSSEDLQFLLDAVKKEVDREHDMRRLYPGYLNFKKMDALHGWRMMIEGSLLDVREQEAEEWVAKQMKEIFSF